jgi:hypothetical protein
MHSVPDAWVRVGSVRRIPGGIELAIVVVRGRRGRVVHRWQVRCLKIRELRLSDFDGGGIRLYPSDHPAARQYADAVMCLNWTPKGRMLEGIGAVAEAHKSAVYDWIPLDRYASPPEASVPKVVWRGPEFLLRKYDQALRRLGFETALIASKCRRKTTKGLRVLHMGSSYVVAERFEAEVSSQVQNSE